MIDLAKWHQTRFQVINLHNNKIIFDGTRYDYEKFCREYSVQPFMQNSIGTINVESVKHLIKLKEINNGYYSKYIYKYKTNNKQNLVKVYVC